MGSTRSPSRQPRRRALGALMSSRGKKKTTFAKLNREARLRERRVEKQARKDARREAAASPAHDLGSLEGHESAPQTSSIHGQPRTEAEDDR